MPMDLTDLELETTARACRAMAYAEEQAAKRMEHPYSRGVGPRLVHIFQKDEGLLP